MKILRSIAINLMYLTIGMYHKNAPIIILSSVLILYYFIKELYRHYELQKKREKEVQDWLNRNSNKK